MSKVTIEFDSYEERDELYEALNWNKRACAMDGFQHWLRSEWKHGDRNNIPVDEVWERWHDFLSDNGVES